MDDWGQQDSTITTEEIDHAIELMAKFRDEYDKAKRISNEHHATFESQKSKVVDLLTRSGKTKYIHEAVGTVSLKVKKTLRIPKDAAGRKACFDHLNLELGEAYSNKFPPNASSLNAYFKEQVENNPDYQIPGVGGYNETVELSLRRKK